MEDSWTVIILNDRGEGVPGQSRLLLEFERSEVREAGRHQVMCSPLWPWILPGLAETRNTTLDQSRGILLSMMQLRSISGGDCCFVLQVCSGVWVAGLTGTYASYTVLQDQDFRTMPGIYRGNS